MGFGHHVYPDPRGLAIPGRNHGPVLARHCRLVHGRASHEPLGPGCVADGPEAAKAVPGTASSLGSRLPVCRWRLPGAPDKERAGV